MLSNKIADSNIQSTSMQIQHFNTRSVFTQCVDIKHKTKNKKQTARCKKHTAIRKKQKAKPQLARLWSLTFRLRTVPQVQGYNEEAMVSDVLPSSSTEPSSFCYPERANRLT